MSECIIHNETILAILIRKNYSAPGIEFLTPSNFSQQLGYMNRPKGYVIEPHVHNDISREVLLTQEVLFIRKGKLRVDFYSDKKQYIKSLILIDGDVILLAQGGHGFEMLEETEIIEVKQGPYLGDKDKTRFNSIDSTEIVLSE